MYLGRQSVSHEGCAFFLAGLRASWLGPLLPELSDGHIRRVTQLTGSVFFLFVVVQAVAGIVGQPFALGPIVFFCGDSPNFKDFSVRTIYGSKASGHSFLNAEHPD